MASRRILGGALFLGVLAVYLSSRVMVQSDSIWSIPTAASLWLRGDANLDEFATALGRERHGVEVVDGHAFNGFPLGPSLAALPVVGALDVAIGGLEHTPLSRWTQFAGARKWRAQLRATSDFSYRYFNTTERFVASLYTGLAALLLFLVAWRVRPGPCALLAPLLFALGTTAYSTASRALWQHGPSLAATSAVVLALSSERRTMQRAWGLGFAVALAYLFRPTNSITVAVVTAYVLLWERRSAVAYFGGAATVAVPFCLYNLRTYDSLLPPYYLAGRLAFFEARFLEALVGNLLSPSRGLLVYTPVVVLALVEIQRRLAQRTLTREEKVFASIVALHWIAISAFPHWWAGHSIGPRFFTDVLPYLAWFWIRPVAEWARAPWSLTWRRAAFGLAVVFSVAVQARAAMSYRVHAWNDGPPNVDDVPARVWSWRNPQFLR